MIFCKRCKNRMLVDRQYTTSEHLETYCLGCGARKFFHPPSESTEGQWLLQKEKHRAKYTIANL